MENQKPFIKMMIMKQAFIILLSVLLNGFMLFAQEKPTVSAQEVADKLSNPVSGMISVPLQGNLDYGIGSYNGSKYTTNIQPVIPINLSRKLNLITRYYGDRLQLLKQNDEIKL